LDKRVAAVVGLVAIGAGLGGAYWNSRRSSAWVSHGFSARHKKQLDGYLDEAVESGSVAGTAVSLMHQGDVVFRAARGFADLESHTPFAPDTPVRLASMSKPVMATGVVILADKGELSLDEPISKWLPEWGELRMRGSGRVVPAPTLRQLMTHSAGLPGNDDKGADGLPGLEGARPSEVSDRVLQYGVEYEPGTEHHYSGYGFTIAAHVAERVRGGKDFEEVLDEVLLRPLGMHDTTFRPSAAMLQRMATPYKLTRGGLKPRRIPPAVEGDAVINPAGGLVSTLDDMTRFYQLHFNRGEFGGQRVVSAAMMEEMYRSNPVSGEHGMGFTLESVDPNTHIARGVQHGGASGVFGWLDFENGVVGLILTQTETKTNRGFRQRIVGGFTQIAGANRTGLTRFGDEASGAGEGSEEDE
jgi:CubicO group peptidase (beta-lactamase class C family)